jgi:hypothetical protein
MTAEEVVRHLLEDADGADLVRDSLRWLVQRLMEAEVTELIGAAHGERSAERATWRNGYRARRSVLDERLGCEDAVPPCVRAGSRLATARPRPRAALGVSPVCGEFGQRNHRPIVARRSDAKSRALRRVAEVTPPRRHFGLRVGPRRDDPSCSSSVRSVADGRRRVRVLLRVRRSRRREPKSGPGSRALSEHLSRRSVSTRCWLAQHAADRLQASAGSI